MYMPNLQIIIGTVLIAVGGILATYGWTARTEASQKSAMIKAVAAELLINLALIDDPKIAETDEKKLSKSVFFPRMQTSTLKGALASGLFLTKRDRLFFTRASDLNELLDGFNDRLIVTQNQMMENPKNIKIWRTQLRDGKTRKQVILKLTKFGALLVSDYGVKESEYFFVPLGEDAT